MAEEESASDPQFLALLHLAWDVSVFVLKPIGLAIGNTLYYIFFAATFVLRLLWRPLEFLLLPLLYLGDFLLRCILAPFRFLAKFETLYIYLGIAALIGLAGGVIISLMSGFLQGVLGLDGTDTPQHARTAKQWREGKRVTKSQNGSIVITASDRDSQADRKRNQKRKRRSVKTGTPTILEELDSDD